MGRGHGLENLTPFLPMMLIAGQRVKSRFSRWKDARFERRAMAWPFVDGRVRGGSVVQVPYAGFRLTLTYDAFGAGHGIGLWKRPFSSKGEAEHARDVLIGQACRVYLNPVDEQEMTLLWRDVQTLLCRQPYVAKPAQLGTVGYRWLAGYTGVAGAGLAASVAVEGLAFAGSSWCVCVSMIWLFFAGVVLLLPSFGIAQRLRTGRQLSDPAGQLRGFVASPQGVVLSCLAAAAVGSLLHYGPAFRALPAEADIPKRVLAGTVGALTVPIYWFAFTAGVQGLRRLKPLRSEAAIPAAV